MDALEFLVSCLEQGRTAIAPALVDSTQRRHLERLHAMNALVQVRAKAVICPRCEAHSVRVIAAGLALCVDCGEVALVEEDMRRLTPDGDWLRRRAMQALGIAPASPLPVVPDRIWRLGDVRRAGARRRILYGERLSHAEAQRALHAAWPTHVGRISTILLSTTPAERIFLPGLPVVVVPLTSAFRIQGTGLVADGPVWEGALGVTSQPVADCRQGPFSHDFGSVLLPGESDPIALTPAQSALMRVLWEQRGTPMHRETLIARAGLEIDKPVLAFQKQKYPEANRVYHALVCSDRKGRYWMNMPDGESNTDKV
jgi:hypothetical protein